MKFFEHRIADQRVVRLIQKWLNAGVLGLISRWLPPVTMPHPCPLRRLGVIT